MRKLFRLIVGVTLSSLGIAMVINSNLGTFAITSCNMAISNWLNIPLSVASILVEGAMIAYAAYKGEGLGITAIVNATYGSIMVDVFHQLLPQFSWLCIGLVLLPIGWTLIGRAGWGDTGSNIVMNSLLKTTGKGVGLIRTIEEVIFIIIGFLGARNYVTWFSLVITILIGPIAERIYKILKYEPTKVNHKYVIQFNRVKNKEVNRI